MIDNTHFCLTLLQIKNKLKVKFDNIYFGPTTTSICGLYIYINTCVCEYKYINICNYKLRRRPPLFELIMYVNREPLSTRPTFSKATGMGIKGYGNRYSVSVWRFTRYDVAMFVNSKLLVIPRQKLSYRTNGKPAFHWHDVSGPRKPHRVLAKTISRLVSGSISVINVGVCTQSFLVPHWTRT